MKDILIPHNLDHVLGEAWEAASNVPGFLLENEARFLGTVAACAPAEGAIVEIGSFKGKSTVMLAKVAQQYGAGRIVAIDPHNFNSAELQEHKTHPEASSFQEFLNNIEMAGVTDAVDVRRAFSSEISPSWNLPIRFLWIDGDHSYQGAKADFDGFASHLVPGGIVAFHDALHEFSGPIRVFVEDVLRSNTFGPAGFVHSIAWAQFRPDDGALFEGERASLERRAARLIRFVRNDSELHGVRKLMFKIARSAVPRSPILPSEWASRLNRTAP